MSQVRQFDHVGITVADLDSVTAFFVGLGLEVEGRTFVEGEFIDTVIGIPDSRTEIVMLRPDRPPRWPTSWVCAAFAWIDDLQAAVDGLAADGYGLVGGIWSARQHLAHGARARPGGNRRLADRADRLTPRGRPLRMRHPASKSCSRPSPERASRGARTHWVCPFPSALRLCGAGALSCR